VIDSSLYWNMKRIMFYNIDSDECAKAILSGCYKFGVATLLRPDGATMTSVIEVEDENNIVCNER
jgi:hypothetical protein